MSPRFRSLTAVVSAVVFCVAVPSLALAQISSTVAGSTATMVGGLSDDNLTITQSGGFFMHNRPMSEGFESALDFDSVAPGEQSVPVAGGIIDIDTGGGADAITVAAAGITGSISINGGDGPDTVAIADGVDLNGAVNGGPGNDTISYAAFTGGVSLNLGMCVSSLSGTLAPAQEVPPTNSMATGTVTVTNYDPATRLFNIQVDVTDLAPADVTGFHIHQAPVGVNGPIIVDLSPLGPLTPNGSGFTFSAAGVNWNGNEAAFLGGGTYVNVHTATFPGGVIRGQLFSSGSTAASGTATGITVLSNVENAVGGSGDDSLVGNGLVNILSGGGGNDWILPGPNNDTLNGDAGTDVLIWSNGDGSDLLEGGADTDTVQVNGSLSILNGDQFTVSPNGTRLDFDRVSPAPFFLDIGTVETLRVNGLGGSDTIAVSDMTGVTSLVTVNLNGFEGDDVFQYRPVAGGAVTYSITGGAGSDTIDYSTISSSLGVTANLGLGTTGLSATLDAEQVFNNPVSSATGTAAITSYSITAHTFNLSITVTGVAPESVTGLHLHQGTLNGFGGTAVDLQPLAALVPAGGGFTFTANGVTLPGNFEALLLGGGMYIDVHTASFPDGVVRGQLYSSGNTPLTSGAATATTLVGGVEHLTGSIGSDSLIGSQGVNVISGGDGSDWLIGGPGNDTLNGDAGGDILTWNNGDGTDVVEGGADFDTILVNGHPTLGDQFTVAPNGARLDFDRTSPGVFSLDIGTVEALMVAGLGGDDSITANELPGTGVFSVILSGYEGNDTIAALFGPANTSLVSVRGGAGTDTLQGPNADTVWSVFPNSTSGFGTLAGFKTFESLAGGSGVDTFDVRDITTPLTVNGGAGEDVLQYWAEFRAVSGDLSPPDGVITSTYWPSPVTFLQMETIQIFNPEPTISIDDVSSHEGGTPATATFTVTLSNSSSLTVSVNYATDNNTATAPDDFTGQSGTLTFAAGETSKTIVVPINIDTAVEANESYYVTLSGAVNASIADAIGEGTITDNFAPTIGGVLPNQTLTWGNTSTPALSFTVNDQETPAASLTVSGSSSNTALVPNGNIVFGGSGANRTVTVTAVPNLPGTTQITITVADASNRTASRTFNFTVSSPTTVQPPVGLYVSSVAGTLVTFRFAPFPYGPQPTGYTLEGGISPGEVLASLPTGSNAPIFSYPVPNGSFYVRMHATNGSQKSGPSNEIRIHVNVPVAPSAPDMFSSTVNGSSLALAWRNTFGGAAPAGVVLDVTGSVTTQLPVGLSESLSVPSAPPGTYTLRLQAMNAGGASPFSSPVTVTIPAPCSGAPEPPSNFLAYRVGNTGYVVWDPPASGPAATSYTLSVTGSFVGTFTTPGRALSGQVGPGSYIVSVTAVNACGTSVPTATQTIDVP